MNDLVVISDDRERHRSVSLSAIAAGEGSLESSALVLETPVEALPDPWRVFRGLRSLIADGGCLTVYSSTAHGHGLAEYHLTNLLTLTGYTVLSRERTRIGYSLSAEKRSLRARELTCSVIVPCRNEEGNVDALVRRVPRIGAHTELIFVDGASTDATVESIERLIEAMPDRDIRLLHQSAAGGKAQAVFQGFDAATGDIVIILDADMTVAPEDLPRFFLALAEDVATFANGTRFAFPMDQGAMPALNNLGNRAFGRLFSWLLDQKVSDTLCGTKALFRNDWQRLRAVRPIFGDHDPWGDFDLLLGARYLGLDIIDVPVRYGARVAGESKMRPLLHGPVLFHATVAGFRQLKLKDGSRRSRES